MKLITAVVKPFTVTDIMEALEGIGVGGITVTEAQGRGRQGGNVEYYRGAKYSSPFVAKAKIEVLVTDEQVDAAVDTIARSAYTGEVGDGKVWVTGVDHVVRVRTGEADDSAILG
ncbi:nitrogen regulatory protein P-II family [Corynebacterium mycetoides]|uniref:Nitrogen regulatory protein P-II family n=1 Tax=Corynebacterium mycetoides TaxID=38302 RepID=A0A1G9N289_9CORY|nr:P-II family nitrogen regulator [Corynebacterium mycetoides]SDL80630.1 nitrogen regulatory protein P-II family [Corynebacterium mycetoides]